MIAVIETYRPHGNYSKSMIALDDRTLEASEARAGRQAALSAAGHPVEQVAATFAGDLFCCAWPATVATLGRARETGGPAPHRTPKTRTRRPEDERKQSARRGGRRKQVAATFAGEGGVGAAGARKRKGCRAGGKRVPAGMMVMMVSLLLLLLPLFLLLLLLLLSLLFLLLVLLLLLLLLLLSLCPCAYQS